MLYERTKAMASSRVPLNSVEGTSQLPWMSYHARARWRPSSTLPSYITMGVRRPCSRMSYTNAPYWSGVMEGTNSAMGWARSAGSVIRALTAFQGEAEIGSLQGAFMVRAYRQWPYPRGAPLRFPAQYLSSMSLCSHALSRQPRRAVCERTLVAPVPD